MAHPISGLYSAALQYQLITMFPDDGYPKKEEAKTTHPRTPSPLNPTSTSIPLSSRSPSPRIDLGTLTHMVADYKKELFTIFKSSKDAIDLMSLRKDLESYSNSQSIALTKSTLDKVLKWGKQYFSLQTEKVGIEQDSDS